MTSKISTFYTATTTAATITASASTTITTTVSATTTTSATTPTSNNNNNYYYCSYYCYQCYYYYYYYYVFVSQTDCMLESVTGYTCCASCSVAGQCRNWKRVAQCTHALQYSKQHALWQYCAHVFDFCACLIWPLQLGVTSFSNTHTQRTDRWRLLSILV